MRRVIGSAWPMATSLRWTARLRAVGRSSSRRFSRESAGRSHGPSATPSGRGRRSGRYGARARCRRGRRRAWGSTERTAERRSSAPIAAVAPPGSPRKSARRRRRHRRSPTGCARRHEHRLDREVREARLPASGPAPRRGPGGGGVVGDPEPHVAPPDQATVIVRPVRDPVESLRHPMAARLVELEAHRIALPADTAGATAIQAPKPFQPRLRPW